MEQETIKTVLSESKVGCSVKQITQLMKIDTTSENLNSIKNACWEMVEAGDLVCTVVKDTDRQFFRLA